MKKSYLILAAVAGLLASCSNEVLVDEAAKDTSAPRAIGFSMFAEKATRGDATVNTNLEFYHNTFAVYGTKKSTVDTTDPVQYVFGGAATAAGVQDGVTCTYQDPADVLLGDWKYDNPRYWDKQANYNFIAYAPVAAANPLRYSFSAAQAEVSAPATTGNDFVITTPGYTLVGTNLQATATEAEKVKGFTAEAAGDIDIMTSAANPQPGTGHDAEVNLVFKHILAKLNVTFAKAAVLDGSTVTINSVTITGLNDNGTYAESVYDNTATPAVSGWMASVVDAAYTLAYAGSQVLNASTGNPFFFIESLVMPQTIPATAELVAKYTITTGTYSEDYTYKCALTSAFATFYDRFNYFLKFTIAPDVIKFDATVTPWVDQTAVNKNID